MNEEKRQTINHYVYVGITSLMILATIVFYFILFTTRPENFPALVMLVLVLTWLCIMMVLPLVVSKKKIVANSNEVDEENTCDENLVKELKNEIVNIKKYLSDFKSEDFEKIQLENSKSVVFSRIKYNERFLRKRIADNRSYYEKNLRSSLLWAVIFAILGLVPLFILIINSKVAPVNVAPETIAATVVNKWPFFGMTLVVEFISGVYLKIYYKILDEMKYYFDEDARITRNAVSLATLVLLNRFECVEQFVMKMVETQKNRVLKKNESTEFIEKQKIENTNNEKLFDLLKSFIKKK